MEKLDTVVRAKSGEYEPEFRGLGSSRVQLVLNIDSVHEDSKTHCAGG